ncbi:MAG TPA: hypothetical protein PLZ57_04435, partial [Pseudobdellovibrionaceae bacterium]|nr:hypothetical protein [Pseudobdellovibrionaceae bacterium]
KPSAAASTLTRHPRWRGSRRITHDSAKATRAGAGHTASRTTPQNQSALARVTPHHAPTPTRKHQHPRAHAQAPTPTHPRASTHAQAPTR